MNEKELQAALDASQAPKGVKADAWDAFQQVKTPEEFKKRFDGLVLPKETKAKLWDLKFPSHGTPSRSFIPKGSGAATAKRIPGADLPLKRTLSSFAEGVGLPRNREELEGMKPSKAEMIGGPMVTAGKMAYRAVRNAGESMTRGLEEGQEAAENIKRGQPVGPNVGKAAYAAVKGFTGALSPLGAEEPVKFGEDIAKGDYASAAGHGLATVVNALLLKGGEKNARENKLTYATGAHPEDIKMVIGDLDRTAAQKGIKVNTIGDLKELGDQTTNAINQEFSLALEAPIDSPPEPSQAFNYQPMDVDQPTGGKRMYHGTKADLEDLSHASPDSHGRIDAKYGIGLYLTDNPEVAKGYGRTKGKGHAGSLHSVKLNDAKLLDMERPATPEVRNVFQGLSPEGEPLKGETTKQIFESLKENMEAAGITSSEATEIYQDLNIKLREMGYDGLRHEGGKTSMGQYGPHNVVILFPDYGVGKPMKSLFSLTSKRSLSPIGPRPLAGTETVPNLISDLIKSKITPNMSQTAQGRQMMKMLLARAVEFEKPWTFRQLDQERMDATARNRAYHKAEASGQRARLRDNVDNIVDKAIEDGTKDLVYSAMDRANNKPAGYYENLKRRQSSLIDFNDQLKKQVERVQKETATQKGSPFLKKHGIHTYGHPESGRIGTSMHRIETIFTDPETSAGRAAKKGMKKPPTVTARQAAALSLPVRMLSIPNFGELTPLPEDDSSH